MPGRSCNIQRSELSDVEQALSTNLRRHIEVLAADIGVRHRENADSLERARQYLTHELRSLGYDVAEHHFAHGINLIAEQAHHLEAELVVVGAHYDTVPVSPGANDNASGVAAVIELARMFAGGASRKRCLRFVLFDNEEHVGQPPTEMGSYAYAKLCRENDERLAGMWSLETIGHFSDAPQSQRYPEPFDLFYPTVGNFVAFVSSANSGKWLRESIQAFRRVARFPSQGVSAPPRFKDINRSDHWGFAEHGYPALMITDTANFRYEHYHKPEDTPDKVNYKSLARLVDALFEALSQLTG